MNQQDKQRLIELHKEALRILRGEAQASAQGGGVGNGPPDEGG